MEEAVRVEKGKRKAREWGEAPGIILVTCNTDNSSDLARFYLLNKEKIEILGKLFGKHFAYWRGMEMSPFVLKKEREKQENGAKHQ